MFNPNSLIGMRVALHPSMDRWMMGDRCGEIVKLGKRKPHLSIAHVKMDRSGKTIRVHMDLLQPID